MQCTFMDRLVQKVLDRPGLLLYRSVQKSSMWLQQKTSKRCLIMKELSAKPFAPKKFVEIKGRQMAFIDEGEGPAIVFAHGNPTSSYLWRNVMPHLKGLGRLVACDMLGMGDSEKLAPSRPDRYHY